MDVQVLVDDGLGNASYLIDLGDGRALAVDPARDPRPYLERAEHLTVAYAADTHVHADFVSGGRELAGLGARLLAPAAAALSYGHRGLADGEEVDLGALTLRAVATAGHSPEHLSYLLLEGSRPVAVFTGGALIVGGVARTDLAEPGPVVLVLADGQDRDAVVEACLKVGQDALAGELDGGMAAWAGDGRPTATTPLVDPGEADGRRLIDVRQRPEWEAGHVPEAVHHELGALPGAARALGGAEPVTVMCGHGERAMTGASLLAAAGARRTAALRGGPAEWAAAHGRNLEYGA